MPKYFKTKGYIDSARLHQHEARSLIRKRNRALRSKFVRKRDWRDIAILDGRAPGLTAFIVSNEPAKIHMVKSMIRSVRKVWHNDRTIEFVHITVIDDAFETSDEKTTLHVKAISDQFRAIAACAPNWIANIELAVFTNRKHPSGGKILSPHVHALVWGHDIIGPLQAVAQRYNARLTAGVAGMDAVRVQRVGGTWGDVEKVLAYSYRPPVRQKTVYYNPRTGRTNLHESEKGDRYVRFLRIFQLQSLIQQDQTCFASGQGVAIRREALAGVHRRLEKETQRSARAPQIAWVEEFWRVLLRRLKLSRFQIPIVVIR